MNPSPFRHWLPLAALLLTLASSAAQARRGRLIELQGYLLEVPSPAQPDRLVIEAAHETVSLKVTADSRVYTELPSDDPNERPMLEVGRAVRVYYYPGSPLLIAANVSFNRIVTQLAGTLTSVEPEAGIEVQPLGPSGESLPPKTYYPGPSSRLFLNSLPLRPEELPFLVGQSVDLLEYLPGYGPYGYYGGLERLRTTAAITRPTLGVIQSTNPTTNSLGLLLPRGALAVTLPASVQASGAVGPIPFTALRLGDRVRYSLAQLRSGANVAVQVALLGVPARTARGRLIGVDPATRSVTVAGKGAAKFQLLPETPLTFGYRDQPPWSITFAQLVASAPDYDGFTVHMQYLVRGSTRIITRLDVIGAPPEPPPFPGKVGAAPSSPP